MRTIPNPYENFRQRIEYLNSCRSKFTTLNLTLYICKTIDFDINAGWNRGDSQEHPHAAEDVNHFEEPQLAQKANWKRSETGSETEPSRVE